MIKLPGSAQPKASLGKIDIIAEHITAAIQLMAIEANPYSTHVLVMAADEMILQVAEARKVALTLDYRIYVKDEYHKDYRDQVRKAYNWFKHADRDANDEYTGPSSKNLAQVNEIQTLVNVKSYTEIGGALTKIFTDYLLFLSIKDPKYMKDDYLKEYPQLKKQYDSLSRDPEVMSAVLRQLVANAGHLPRD